MEAKALAKKITLKITIAYNKLGIVMEIPGNDFKVKGKAIQDRIKVTGEKASKAGASGGPS